MKRLLIGLLAVAGLLGSVLALVASSTNPASGQTTAPITLRNTQVRAASATNPIAEDQVRVSVVPLQGCTPRTGGALNNRILQPSGTTGDILVVSLDTNCSWQITFAQVANTCVTTGLVNDNSDTNDANTAVNGNPIQPTILINGLGAGGGLRYTGSADHDGNPATPRQPVTAITPTKIDFSINSNACATRFTPVATINIPAPAASYRGLEFVATFTTNRQGQLAALCASGTSTYVIDSAGMVVPKRDSNNRPMTASLIDRTLGDLAGTGRCTYTASFTPEVGSLWLARAAGRITPPTYSSGRTDISGETIGTTNTVSVSYSKISVPIVVRSTFPQDEVFTTEDRVDYTVSINSPCGGYLGVLPAGLGNQGDSASAQVFPGTVIVYGNQLQVITQGVTAMRSYRVDAYADALGTRVCSVTVTEDSGPERCSVVGGPSQQDTYAAGKTALAFEFTHICEPVGVSGGQAEEGDGPPAPPSIDLPGVGGDDSDPPAPPTIPSEGETTAPTTPSGPPEEGRTG